jgi:DNA-binding response OmpR family regulator
MAQEGRAIVVVPQSLLKLDPIAGQALIAFPSLRNHYPMPPRIVVIDDAPEIVEFYEELLTDEGYDVIATFTGPPNDPQVIGQHRPDIVILDWLFGREAVGMRILDMLKAYPPTANTPIIVCTAAHQEITEVEGVLKQRGVRVLHKPFAIDDLVAMIRQVLV